MFDVDVNLLAVLVATVVFFLIGGLWYTVLFAKQWTKLSGMAEKLKEKSDSPSAGPFIATFILLFVLCYVLAHVLALIGVGTIGESLATGAWLWLGFVGATMLNNAIFAGRPHKLTAIDTGYYLVGILVASAILTAWA